MSNHNEIIAQLKENAFKAAKLVKAGGYTASDLGLKQQLLGGNGNHFSDNVLKPFVDALFTRDTAAIGRAMQLLTQQARNIMGVYEDPERGVVFFAARSQEEQAVIAVIGSRYVEQIERVVKTYIDKIPGTGVAILASR